MPDILNGGYFKMVDILNGGYSKMVDIKKWWKF